MGPVESLPAVVFAFIDGTALDPYLCSDVQDAPGLEALEQQGIPVVLHSGRTRAELECIVRQLGLHHPFVCENGAAALVPRAYFPYTMPHALAGAGYDTFVFGQPYTHVVGAVRRVADRLKTAVIGFHDMSPEEIARDCGLSLAQARLAKRREYDEPCWIPGATPAHRRQFQDAVRLSGLDCSPGTRYDQVGAVTDRGAAVAMLGAMYKRAFGSTLTIGLGLQRADQPWCERVDTYVAAPGIEDVPAASRSSAWLDAILDAVRRAAAPTSPAAALERGEIVRYRTKYGE